MKTREESMADAMQDVLTSYRGRLTELKRDIKAGRCRSDFEKGYALAYVQALSIAKIHMESYIERVRRRQFDYMTAEQIEGGPF